MSIVIKTNKKTGEKVAIDTKTGTIVRRQKMPETAVTEQPSEPIRGFTFEKDTAGQFGDRPRPASPERVQEKIAAREQTTQAVKGMPETLKQSREFVMGGEDAGLFRKAVGIGMAITPIGQTLIHMGFVKAEENIIDGLRRELEVEIEPYKSEKGTITRTAQDIATYLAPEFVRPTNYLLGGKLGQGIADSVAQVGGNAVKGTANFFRKNLGKVNDFMFKHVKKVGIDHVLNPVLQSPTYIRDTIVPTIKKGIERTLAQPTKLGAQALKKLGIDTDDVYRLTQRGLEATAKNVGDFSFKIVNKMQDGVRQLHDVASLAYKKAAALAPTDDIIPVAPLVDKINSLLDDFGRISNKLFPKEVKELQGMVGDPGGLSDMATKAVQGATSEIRDQLMAMLGGASDKISVGKARELMRTLQSGIKVGLSDADSVLKANIIGEIGEAVSKVYGGFKRPNMLWSKFKTAQNYFSQLGANYKEISKAAVEGKLLGNLKHTTRSVISKLDDLVSNKFKFIDDVKDIEAMKRLINLDNLLDEDNLLRKAVEYADNAFTEQNIVDKALELFDSSLPKSLKFIDDLKSHGAGKALQGATRLIRTPGVSIPGISSHMPVILPVTPITRGGIKTSEVLSKLVKNIPNILKQSAAGGASIAGGRLATDINSK